MHTPVSESRWVRLRVEGFRKRAEQAGLTTDADIARHLGMHRITVSRLLAEQTSPGISFVAAVLDTFPGCQFPDFFEITRDAARPRAA